MDSSIILIRGSPIAEISDIALNTLEKTVLTSLNKARRLLLIPVTMEFDSPNSLLKRVKNPVTLSFPTNAKTNCLPMSLAKSSNPDNFPWINSTALRHASGILSVGLWFKALINF